MHYKETTIPPAYFITFTCYGTWLHGAKATSVDRLHNTPGTAFVSYHQSRAFSVQNRMVTTPYELNDMKRHIVLYAIQETCEHRAWILYASHVRTNHVHLVIHATVPPEHIMNSIKSYCSRHLTASTVDDRHKNRWTRHGSTRYLWTEEEIQATIHYVVHEQGTPMAVYENKDLTF